MEKKIIKKKEICTSDKNGRIGCLVLGDGVDEGVARAGVANEEGADAVGERAKVAHLKKKSKDLRNTM